MKKSLLMVALVSALSAGTVDAGVTDLVKSIGDQVAGRLLNLQAQPLVKDLFTETGSVGANGAPWTRLALSAALVWAVYQQPIVKSSAQNLLSRCGCTKPKAKKEAVRKAAEDWKEQA